MKRSETTFEEKIRKRKSYTFWNLLGGRIAMAGSKASDILPIVYEEMNKFYMFGTEQNALWAKQSLDLLMKDINSRGDAHAGQDSNGSADSK